MTGAKYASVATVLSSPNMTTPHHSDANTTPPTTKKFSQYLALFLPGIFLLGFNIGTGSVTAMAKAGATYGM